MQYAELIQSVKVSDLTLEEEYIVVCFSFGKTITIGKFLEWECADLFMRAFNKEETGTRARVIKLH